MGEKLPESTRVYRVKVACSMIKAGVPFNNVDRFCDLLEEHAFFISTSLSLSQLIPFILQNEIAHLKDEIARQYVSIIFDGTTHVREALVILL